MTLRGFRRQKKTVNYQKILIFRVKVSNLQKYYRNFPIFFFFFFILTKKKGKKTVYDKKNFLFILGILAYFN